MKLRVVGENMNVSAGLRDFVTRRLESALGRFTREAERVTARVGDVNGPRGGLDKRCRMVVKLRGLDSVLSEARAEDLETVVTLAAERLARGVTRALKRRCQRRRRPGVSMAGLDGAAENGHPLKKRDTPAVEPEEL